LKAPHRKSATRLGDKDLRVAPARATAHVARASATVITLQALAEDEEQ
jgi:hypothetical protein